VKYNRKRGRRETSEKEGNQVGKKKVVFDDGDTLIHTTPALIPFVLAALSRANHFLACGLGAVAHPCRCTLADAMYTVYW
jgi:hypothetical protein